MMELTGSDVMALVKAGYTKNEIVQMQLGTVPAQEPEPVPEAEPEPEQLGQDGTDQHNPEPAGVVKDKPDEKPVSEQFTEQVANIKPDPKPEPAQAEQYTMSDIMQGIAKLTSAIQANAIAQSTIPNSMLNPPDASDMIAEIIRPSYKERR